MALRTLSFLRRKGIEPGTLPSDAVQDESEGS